MPSPGPGEVRVRVLATSVQFTDVMIRKGNYPGLARQLPLVLGYDVVGEVDELGPGVAAVSVGDRVAALTVTGSHGRYRTLCAEQVVPVPKFVDPAEAVALVLSWTTAYQLLHRVAQVRPGQRMLVIGAGGAVGQALLTLGKRAGLEMWGTARRRSAELVRSLGATAVDFEAEDCRTLVRGGFDVVMDGIGERGFTRSWARQAAPSAPTESPPPFAMARTRLPSGCGSCVSSCGTTYPTENARGSIRSPTSSSSTPLGFAPTSRTSSHSSPTAASTQKFRVASTSTPSRRRMVALKPAD